MYDEFAEELLQQLPQLAETNWEECRRRLSRLYFAIIQLRLNGPDLGGSQDAVLKASDYLRRLANAIEQCLFNEPTSTDEQMLNRARSYAFIAAEAIDLWCSFAKTVRQDCSRSVNITYAQIECALLYLASDYQVNAHCSVPDLNEDLFLEIYDLEQRDRIVVRYLQSTICALATGNLKDFPSVPDIDYSQFDAIIAARTAIMVRIGSLIKSYGDWLIGQNAENEVEQGLQRLLTQLKPTSSIFSSGQFADLLHLCTLLIYVIRASSPLSVMHHLLRQALDAEASIYYERYLASRASRRPFFWPSAKEYVMQAFPGPCSDAVVVVPTGSGKSFLAELACSQAMQNGWVLYLAPTNALVNQVQRDLRSAFEPFDEAQILSFIGGQEYTSLDGEYLDAPSNMSVAVMTPEKCAMVCRINPDVFLNCQLCIVDEFHLINDENRGITLDLCLAQILTINPETHLLLMSAMVSNGRDVKAWLQSLRNGQEVSLIQVPWRPCRTLRSLLIVDNEKTREAFIAAKSNFSLLPASRKNVEFDAPLGLLGGMRLQWNAEGNIEDYVSVPIPVTFKAKAKRNSQDIDWTGWKNTAGRQLSEILYRKGSSVLCFILTSKHHVFSCAENSDLDCEIDLDQHTCALLNLADIELGVSSKVGDLLRKGIGVHSSAMLETEQAAVERSFRNRYIGLLFATPTLAQGLNLPADVVIVAGSSLGDARQAADNMHGVRSSDATILNAFGRAGRAMVANHGLAILVSDNPFSGPLREGIGIGSVIKRYRLMSGSDRCVQIASPIASFIERLTPEAPLNAFTAEEFELVAQLGGENAQNVDVLNHTFGAYLAQRRQEGLSVEAAAGRIKNIEMSLLQEYEMPEWMPMAAMKGGIDLLTCWRLWKGLTNCREFIEDNRTTTMEGCLQIFIQAMSWMPPKDIRKILPVEVRKMNTVLDRMLEKIGENEFAVDWEFPDDWAELWTELSNLVWMYMNGSTYAEIAATYLKIEIEEIDGKRSQGQAPIPALFSFVGYVMHHLSLFAGALLVILEESDHLGEQLGEMPLLPLCIRNGCCNRDSLAWFRYGYRNRIVAHEFARIFPIPEEIQEDSEVKLWVKRCRKEWLNEEANGEDPLVLRSVRIIIS